MHSFVVLDTRLLLPFAGRRSPIRPLQVIDLEHGHHRQRYQAGLGITVHNSAGESHFALSLSCILLRDSNSFSSSDSLPFLLHLQHFLCLQAAQLVLIQPPVIALHRWAMETQRKMDQKPQASLASLEASLELLLLQKVAGPKVDSRSCLQMPSSLKQRIGPS